MDGNPSTYLDTSGTLAFLDADDECHSKAVQAWQDVLSLNGEFVMTDYVRLESWSLIQRRLGMEAAEDYHEHILPICEVCVVGESGFALLARQLFLFRRRKVSLVDLSSFDCMRRLGIHRALAFDKHFTESGFLTPEQDGW